VFSQFFLDQDERRNVIKFDAPYQIVIL